MPTHFPCVERDIHSLAESARLAWFSSHEGSKADQSSGHRHNMGWSHAQHCLEMTLNPWVFLTHPSPRHGLCLTALMKSGVFRRRSSIFPVLFCSCSNLHGLCLSFLTEQVQETKAVGPIFVKVTAQPSGINSWVILYVCMWAKPWGPERSHWQCGQGKPLEREPMASRHMRTWEIDWKTKTTWPYVHF